MSGRARLALCATVATLCAACALLPLVDPVTWMFEAAILLALLSGVGAAARRVPLAGPLTIAVQALAVVPLMTLLFVRDEAVLGLLPGPDALTEFGRLLEDGVRDVGRYAIPAPVTPGIRLLLVSGVLVIGLAVDALAVTYRTAAPAGLPLLALYSVAAGLSRDGAGWLLFLIAAAGYLLLLLAEGRDRLSQWGRVFGGPGNGADRPGGGRGFATGAGGPAGAPVRTGRRIGALALGLAVAVPALLPSLDGGLLVGSGNGAGPGSGGGTISAVNPLVSLQDSLNQPEDREVLNYRTTASDTRDLYLRIVALDQFDGTTWKPSERTVTDVPERLPRPPGLGSTVDLTRINTSISTAGWYAQNWLPLPYPASKVDISGRWRFEPKGRTLVGDRGQNTHGLQYQVESLQVRPTPGQLAAAPAPPAGLLREYTKVPASLPAVVRNTARRVTRGAPTTYAKAVKLQDWFAVNGGFSYNTDVRAGSGSGAIARFLRQKEGFCVHFSFSMAAMARTLGIPARVAVGFTPGTKQPDGTTSVGLKDAHAWPELYFQGIGWTRFEPTPSRGSVPDYAYPDSRDTTGPDTPAPAPSRPTAPSEGPSADPSCGPDGQRSGSTPGCISLPTETNARPPESGSSSWAPLGLALAGALVLLLPTVPLLWRRRLRSRRLAGDGPDGDGAAGTVAAWRELLDTAWDFGIPPDDSLTPRKAAARIIRLGQLPPEPAAAVQRVAAAVEQVLYAPQPQPASGLAADVHQVRAGLRDGASRAVRLRAQLAPRSAARLRWAWSARWTAWLLPCRTSRPVAAARRAAASLRPGRQRA
ncbi:transglutaminase family protein [Streptomyces angustmyceticus]|uniref:transglutaminase family protein n=1 Tax=Streptomyces angustmyceticus TaxID=285578 RepID=UPI0021B06D17|nr:transglutaminaseTgpA domain-containing protein [Streptomyces angustmyceticus]